MASALVVVVLDREGRVVDYVAPMELGFSKIKEATRIGYDIFRAVSFILKGLGYSMPKNMTIHYNDMDITVIPRESHVVVSITTEITEPPKALGPSPATMEA